MNDQALASAIDRWNKSAPPPRDVTLLALFELAAHRGGLRLRIYGDDVDSIELVPAGGDQREGHASGIRVEVGRTSRG